MVFALAANFSVDRVSSTDIREADAQHRIAVQAFPSRLDCKIRVSLESRNPMCLGCFFDGKLKE
jgi:hypothetical protein